MELKQFLLLKKFAPKIKVKKLPVYTYCKNNQTTMDYYHLKLDATDEISLENTKAYIMSIKNKEKIDLIYSEIGNNPFVSDVLDFITLNKIIEHEILERIGEFPHFYDPDLILIPIFDHKLNFDFVYDYLRTKINWEKNLWKNELIEKKNPIDRYGHYFYHFTDFQYINHYDHLYYFYLDQTNRIYIFDENNKEFIEDFPICDTKCNKDITITVNELIEIVELFANEEYQLLIQYLLDMNLICDKTYTKVLKGG